MSYDRGSRIAGHLTMSGGNASVSAWHLSDVQAGHGQAPNWLGVGAAML
ncbi:MAG: hypothetical protein JWQ65_2454 [Devosia sp.]|nr:hypothetical protein [Devosia sp.]